MKVSAEKIENQQVVLTIEVESADLDKAENRATTLNMEVNLKICKMLSTLCSW